MKGVVLVTRILLIDDEVQFSKAITISLRARGYEVECMATGRAGLSAAARRHPDIVLLDLGLPDIDGIEVLRDLRTWTELPVVVLSARSQEQVKIDALDCGADDYVTKPFGLGELLARIRAALRKRGPDRALAVITTEDFTVDLVKKEVTNADGAVRLSPTEWYVLEVLAMHLGALVTQRQLLRTVWGPTYERETEYLRVYTNRIRRKLEPVPSRPRYFFTEPGIGYRFEVPDRPASTLP